MSPVRKARSAHPAIKTARPRSATEDRRDALRLLPFRSRPVEGAGSCDSIRPVWGTKRRCLSSSCSPASAVLGLRLPSPDQLKEVLLGFLDSCMLGGVGLAGTLEVVLNDVGRVTVILIGQVASARLTHLGGLLSGCRTSGRRTPCGCRSNGSRSAITLIFSLTPYSQVIDACLPGLGTLLARGGDPTGSTVSIRGGRVVRVRRATSRESQGGRRWLTCPDPKGVGIS